MSDYEPTQAARVIEKFVTDDLSNWHVRLSRRRFWKSESSVDKQAAFETLYECLMVIGQLMSTHAPFFAEWLYKSLSDPIREKAKAMNSPLRFESVHLSNLTKCEENRIDESLERRMDYAQRICSLVLSLRKAQKLRVRQPLTQILLPVLNTEFKSDIESVEELIKSEVNIKQINYLTEDDSVIKKKAKPNFRTLGKKLGKAMQEGARLIQEFGMADIKQLESGNTVKLSLHNEQYEIAIEDVEIVTEDIPGWLVSHDGELTVALDIALNDDLIAEGYARELINRIQNVRKTKDFNVTDRIQVKLEPNKDIEIAVNKFGDLIKSEVLANSIQIDPSGFTDSFDWLEDVVVQYSIEKAAV